MSGRTLEKLIYMANQIAREFAGQRPRDAAEATWDHLWHFWDPRMREMIVEHMRSGDEGLSDIARAAVERLAAPVEPAPRTQATEFNHLGDGEAETMSDAG